MKLLESERVLTPANCSTPAVRGGARELGGLGGPSGRQAPHP